LDVDAQTYVFSTLTGSTKTQHTNTSKLFWLTPSTRLSATILVSTGLSIPFTSTVNLVVSLLRARNLVALARDTDSIRQLLGEERRGKDTTLKVIGATDRYVLEEFVTEIWQRWIGLLRAVFTHSAYGYEIISSEHQSFQSPGYSQLHKI